MKKFLCNLLLFPTLFTSIFSRSGQIMVALPIIVAKPLAITSLVGILACGNLAYGNKYSNEILVNTYTESYQGRSDIAVGEKGNVVITWESLYQDGSLLGVYAQRFDREMNKMGEEIQVNSYTENHQHKPKIAIDKEGNFVITWESQAD